MIEFVSWIGVAIIALFAVVGFTGVVVMGVVTAVRAIRIVRRRELPVETAEAPHFISAA